MTKIESSNLDALISACVHNNVTSDGKVFKAIDTSGISENPEFKEKILSQINKTHPTILKWRLKTALVACLILISVLFTACMCIPTIRESIWSAVINFYDKYLVINHTPDTPNEQIPPKTIEKIAELTYVPEGYYAELFEDDLTTSKMIVIYDSISNDVSFILQQYTVYEEVMISYDESFPITKTTINGHEATLIEYPNEDGTYMLIWSDGVYQYYLNGYFTTADTIIKIAQGVKLD